MNVKVKSALTSTIFLKAVSVVIGFMFWSIVSDSFTSYKWVTVPIAFYNKKDQNIVSPNTIKVELKGRKIHLKNIDKSALSLHIDAQTLKPGPNCIEVTPDLLFLPSTVAIGETVPHNITIHVEQGTKP